MKKIYIAKTPRGNIIIDEWVSEKVTRKLFNLLSNKKKRI